MKRPLTDKMPGKALMPRTATSSRTWPRAPPAIPPISRVRWDMFVDRTDAGCRLAGALAHLRGDPDVVVVGLPRGGVPVAAVVADGLGVDLDIIIVRKLGVPRRPELAMGAIAEDRDPVLNVDVIESARVAPDELDRVLARERAELDDRVRRWRTRRARLSLADHVVVIVDDGVATGATVRAACEVARDDGAARVVLAVPVAPPDWVDRLGTAADEYVCVDSPAGFRAVGQVYDDFSQTTDAEVVDLLRGHA